MASTRSAKRQAAPAAPRGKTSRKPRSAPSSKPQQTTRPLPNGTIKLPGNLGLSSLAEFEPCLRDWATLDDVSLVIDASDVERIGAPAIQLLFSLFEKSAPGCVRPLLVDPSTAFRGAMADLGLGSALEDWTEKR